MNTTKKLIKITHEDVLAALESLNFDVEADFEEEEQYYLAANLSKCGDYFTDLWVGKGVRATFVSNSFDGKFDDEKGIAIPLFNAREKHGGIVDTIISLANYSQKGKYVRDSFKKEMDFILS